MNTSVFLVGNKRLVVCPPVPVTQLIKVNVADFLVHHSNIRDGAGWHLGIRNQPLAAMHPPDATQGPAAVSLLQMQTF